MTTAFETCTTPASSRYGAPMGRASRCLDTETDQLFHLRRVSIDSGGYDQGDAYWGHGAPIYEAFSVDGSEFMTLRLDPAERSALAAKMRANGDDPLEFGSAWLDRRTAKAQVWDIYPNARLFR